MFSPGGKGWEKVLVNLIAFAFFLGIPALFSAVAPVSVVEFTRKNERVRADVSRRLFYAIPYYRAAVDDVQSVDDRIRSGGQSRSRSRSSSDQTSVESQAFLVIRGRNSVREVLVSTENIRAVLEKAQAFVAPTSEQSDLRLTVVANWKLSVLLPLLWSPLTLLYVVGVSVSGWRWVKPHLWRR